MKSVDRLFTFATLVLGFHHDDSFTKFCCRYSIFFLKIGLIDQFSPDENHYYNRQKTEKNQKIPMYSPVSSRLGLWFGLVSNSNLMIFLNLSHVCFLKYR